MYFYFFILKVKISSKCQDSWEPGGNQVPKFAIFFQAWSLTNDPKHKVPKVYSTVIKKIPKVLSLFDNSAPSWFNSQLRISWSDNALQIRNHTVANWVQMTRLTDICVIWCYHSCWCISNSSFQMKRTHIQPKIFKVTESVIIDRMM